MRVRPEPARRRSPDDGLVRPRRRRGARRSRRPCGPRALDEFIGQQRVRDQLEPGARGGHGAGRAADHVLLSGPPGPRQDHPRHDHRRGARRAAAHHQRARHPARRRPGRDAVAPRRGRGALPRRDPPDGAAGRGDALHRHGGLPGRRRRRQGAGGHRDPAGAAARSPWSAPPPGPGCCPGPLRDRFGFTGHLDFYAAGRAELGARPLGAALLDVELAEDAGEEIAGRSRGTPRDRQPAAAPGARLRRGPRRRPRSTAPRRRRPSTLYEVDLLGLDRLDRAVLDALCAGSAAGRSGCPPSPSPSGRSARPSRRSPSRSSCGPACWRGRRGAGSPPPRPGRTSGSRCPRRGLRGRRSVRGRRGPGDRVDSPGRRRAPAHRGSTSRGSTRALLRCS